MLWIVLATMVMAVCCQGSLADEYCFNETFTPKCDEIVVMKKAIIGLMSNESRCYEVAVKKHVKIMKNIPKLCDWDRIDNFYDIFTVQKKKSFHINNSIEAVCTEFINKYIDVEYECLKEFKLRNCEKIINPSTERKIFLNLTAAYAECGTSDNPIVIKFDKISMHLVLKLWNYAPHWQLDEITNTIQIKHVSRNTDYVHRANQRTIVLLSEETNEVQINFKNGKPDLQIIELTVLGCTEIFPPKYGYVTRIGKNNSEAVVSCNDSIYNDQTMTYVNGDMKFYADDGTNIKGWLLKCDETSGRWVGSHGDCSHEGDIITYFSPVVVSSNNDCRVGPIVIAVILIFACIVPIIYFGIKFQFYGGELTAGQYIAFWIYIHFIGTVNDIKERNKLIDKRNGKSTIPTPRSGILPEMANNGMVDHQGTQSVTPIASEYQSIIHHDYGVTLRKGAPHHHHLHHHDHVHLELPYDRYEVPDCNNEPGSLPEINPEDFQLPGPTTSFAD